MQNQNITVYAKSFTLAETVRLRQTFAQNLYLLFLSRTRSIHDNIIFYTVTLSMFIPFIYLKRVREQELILSK